MIPLKVGSFCQLQRGLIGYNWYINQTKGKKMIAFQIKKLFAVINMLVIAFCFYAYFISPNDVTDGHLFGFVFWLIASIATYKILCAVTDMCASIFTAYKKG